ncbi:MAG: class II aldolase/adducin family protein [Actinomycetota bacterium]|nr:class II aldolase/adducin family protein [Actinomycetota bacterium]
MTPLLDQLIAVGRKAVARGLVIGSGGNLSAREPGAGACWVTASGTWLDELAEDSFSCVRISDGALQEGNPAPSSEVALHLHSYRARPDINAIIHLHPQTSVLLDAMGHQISLVTLDQAYYVRQVRSTPFIQSGTAELAQAGADAIRDGCNCVILGHHGCSVVADSIELAHKRAANLEEAAEATYRALLLGGPVPQCPPAYLEAIRQRESDTA